MSYTIGIVVFFLGMTLNDRVGPLRSYNIPEPVTGGILVACLTLVLHVFFGIDVQFDLTVRDTLLVYFFTSVGLNARVSDLLAGGRTLGVLLALTLAYIVIQDGVGVAAAMALGQPKAVGVLAGSASLIGGHGTAIAWAPDIAAKYGVANALEIGVAAATLGLVLASLLGGPMSKLLLSIPGTSAPAAKEGSDPTTDHNDDGAAQPISHVNLMGVILALHAAIILGYFLNQAFTALQLKLPLFVSCLLVGIVLSNTVPRIVPRLPWPARTQALAVVSEFSLGLFIAMSLMGMQLWSIADLAGPLLILLGAQLIAAMLFIRFVFFPLMGRNYLAVVLSAGFAGFSLGATPTAIANMTAVTKSHGPAPTAFIILPLVGAFFVDITNAFVIKFFLNL